MQLTAGHSDAIETAQAIRQVLAACAGVEAPVAALLWMSPEYDADEVVRAVSERWPGLPLAGCTSDGVLSSVRGFSHEGLLLTLISGAGLRAQVQVAEGLSRRGAEAVREACAALDPNPAMAFAFPAAVNYDVHAATAELERLLGCPLVGGCSADHREFDKCAELGQGRTWTDSIPILALYGDLEISVERGSGWFPVGREHRVTRAEGNQLFEVDGKPAAQVLQRYFGVVDEGPVVEFPLAFAESAEAEPYYRAVFGVDLASGAMTLGGGVPEGALLRMSEVELEGALRSSREALDRSRARVDSPSAAFIFNCAGRKWVLGSSVEREVASLLDGLPEVPIVGTYGFGELGRAPGPSETPVYHNETCITVLVAPRRRDAA